MMTMHCPHASVNCSTCENSAAARELRALRHVAQLARRVADTEKLSSDAPSQSIVSRDLMRELAWALDDSGPAGRRQSVERGPK